MRPNFSAPSAKPFDESELVCTSPNRRHKPATQMRNRVRRRRFVPTIRVQQLREAFRFCLTLTKSATLTFISQPNRIIGRLTRVEKIGVVAQNHF